MQMNGWKRWAVGSVAALTVMGGGLMTAHNVLAATPETPAAESTDAQPPQPFGFGEGRMDRGFGQFSELSDEGQASLAEALGISVEELEAAQDAARMKAHEDALAEAVANGDITQDEADAMKEIDGLWGDRSLGRGRFDDQFVPGLGYDTYDSYLAEALGISVGELEAARDAAAQSELAQAVVDGKLSQEQADEYVTGLALRDYVATAMEDALASALEKAVADGAVTQEQADVYLEEWQGRGTRGFLGDFPGGMWDDTPGPGGMRDNMPGELLGEQRGQRPGMRGGFDGDESDEFPGGGRGGMRGGSSNGMRDGTGPLVPDTESSDGIAPESGVAL